MIDNEEIYEKINSRGTNSPININEYSTLKKILWILKISKDNSPAKALSCKAISYLAYRLLEEDISEASIRSTIARAGNTIMKKDGKFYEITRQGKEKLEENKEKSNIFEEKIYDKNSRFDFRVDIKEIFNKANKELFIVDSWIDEDLLEIYLKNIKRNLKIKVLSGDNPKGKISKLINDYNNQFNDCLEIRESSEIHDRGVFIDNKEGWVMGQSIKDAAKNKPTYITKLRDSKKLESIYNSIWSFAKKIK